MSDDSIRIKDSLRLVGHATLATLEVLESRGLLAPGSVVRDIALVLGRLIEVIMAWPGDYAEPEFSWVKTVIAKAEGKGIKIAGAPFGVEESVNILMELDSDDDDDGEGDGWEDEDRALGMRESAWIEEVSSRKFISSLGIEMPTNPSFCHSLKSTKTTMMISVAASTISPRRSGLLARLTLEQRFHVWGVGYTCTSILPVGTLPVVGLDYALVIQSSYHCRLYSHCDFRTNSWLHTSTHIQPSTKPMQGGSFSRLHL